MAILPRSPLHRPEFRFEVRPYDFSCVPALYEAAEESKGSVSPWMGWLHANYNLQDAENWTAHAIKAWNEQTDFEFVIYDRKNGNVAGCCGLNKINKQDMVCNLGYWVRPSKTHHGAATQAVALLKEFAFSTLSLNRLEIVVADGNGASRAVAEKSEAVYEGLQRSRLRVGEKIHNAHMYALIRVAVA